MPLALDPQQTFRLSLKSDREKDLSCRPAFIFRYLTGREEIKVGGMLDSMDMAKESEQAVTAPFDALRVALADWDNITDCNGNDIPYDPEKLEDVLRSAEAVELAFVILCYTPDEDDLKNSESQLSTPSDSSANPEPAENA